MNAAKLTAIAVGLVAWGGLILQFGLIVRNLGFGLGSWRFVGFFTILTNFGIACIATAMALGKVDRLAGPRGRLLGLTAIIVVGLVYSLLLRSLWNPTGWQKLADVALHDATPLLFAMLWLLTPHGTLTWSDLKWALLPPAMYLGYALARGAVDGWYAYWFLNPTTQTVGELTVSIVAVLALFSAVAVGAIALDRWLGRGARLAGPA